ncbi:MAG: glycosyltransferase family 2 protein [Caldimonas sp.]
MKISVVTATYNAAQTLEDSLRSVAQQTHPDIEHWVIDGGSDDGTQAIVEQHRSALAGFVSEPDHGIYDALNKGIARSTGDVVGFLHADDVYAETDTLATIAAAFADPAVDAVYGDLVYVDRLDPSRVIRYWRAGEASRNRLMQGWMPPHPTFYARRSVYQQLGAFDTRYRIAADYDSLVRFLFVAGIRAVYLPRVLVCMRMGGVSNRSFRTIVTKSREDLDIMRKHRLGGVSTLMLKNASKVAQFWTRRKIGAPEA